MNDCPIKNEVDYYANPFAIDRRAGATENNLGCYVNLHKIANHLPGLLYQFRLHPDGSSCFPYASAVIQDIYRVSPEEVRESSAKVLAVTHPDDYERIIHAMNVSAQNLTPWYQEYRIRFEDSSERWLLGSSLPQREADGSTLWYGFITDITEQKKNELEKAQLQAFYELNLVGLAISSPTKGWLRVNDYLCKMLEYSSEELHQLTWVDLTYPEDLAIDVDQFERLLANEIDCYTIEKRYVSRTGKIIPAKLVVSCVRGADGKIDYAVAMVEDITERKEAEENLARSKLNFFANLSHEIRTPMNAIIGLSRLALKKEVSVEVRNYLNKIYNSSGQLLGILNDVLDFSKLAADGFKFDHSVFDLNVIMANLDNLFINPAEATRVDFKMIVAPDVPRALIGDSTKLQQVLTNLLSNAKKFTEQGEVVTTVEVQHRVNDNVELCFTVWDTGIGMTTEQIDKLFKPFSQADTSITRKYGGTGLGLAICKQLVELMGGKIHVTSFYGEGSTFEFNLPFAVAPIQVISNKVKIADSPSTNYHAQRILLVEDNEINQLVALELLTSRGLSVQIANNGEEGVALALAEPFDLILMDIQMPGMDGLTATRLIRAEPRLKNIPIIAMTAHAMHGDKEKSLAAGMNDHLTKPIDVGELVATLNHWLKMCF